MNHKRNRRNFNWAANVGKEGAFRRFIARPRAKKSAISGISDFSDIENNPDGINEIQKLAGQAGLAAASEAKAVGIPRVFARGNEIIREFADGRHEIVSPAGRQRERTFYRHLTTKILHARKK